ncbi:MAG: DEAD/DEAH box helicase, partial [Planctomycetota bacterium]|nr:DEAD/DEAH box helicase [Planctomycetota bacterium]
MTPPRFAPNALVRRRLRTSDVGPVMEHPPPRLVGGIYQYRVLLNGVPQFIGEDELEAVDASTTDPYDAFLAGSFGDRGTVITYLTYLRLREALSNYVYAFQNSRTQFFPHQFKPVLRFLEGNGRLLIADEVGLGKTIEAGLILLELRARRALDRAFVVCPANLREKWRRELLQRFDLDFSVFTVKDLVPRLRELKETPGTPFFGIASYETIRAEKVLQQLDDPFALELDIVVADEAHRLRNSGRKTYTAGQSLAALARHMLMLTATPINNTESDLFNELALLEPELFQSEAYFAILRQLNEHVVDLERALRRAAPDPADIARRLDFLESISPGDQHTTRAVLPRLRALVQDTRLASRDDQIEAQRLANRLNFLSAHMNRTRRRDVDEKRPEREAHFRPAPMSAEEEKLYQAVYELALRHYEHHPFPVIAMERILSSSIPAFIHRYGGPAAVGPVPAQEEVESSTDADDADDMEQRLAADDDFLVADERIPGLGEILATFGQAVVRSGRDSKLDELVQIFEELERAESGRKAIVFSFFRGTIHYLERELTRRGIKCVVIHGGVPTDPGNPKEDERERRRNRFQHDPSVRVMLSSEVGSEGLDFQFAHVVINYDLPWNPMVVEQRIGRVDRIGQRSDKVLIYSLALRGTVDDRIHARLLDKINIYRTSIGDLESILGKTVHDLREVVFCRHLTAAEQLARVDHMADVIAKRRRDIDDLEEGAARVIGTDQYLRDEIDRVRTGRRFVAAAELEVFVHEVFRRPEINVDVERDTLPGAFRAQVTARFRDLVRHRLDESRPARLFLGRLGEVVRWTFDQDLANDHPELELFNINHPLVRALVTHLEEEAGRTLPPNFNVRVAPGEDLEPGRSWALGAFLCELSTPTAKAPRRELIVLPLDLQTGELGSRAQGDRLLAAVLASSKAGRPIDGWTPDMAGELLQALTDAATMAGRERRDRLQEDETAHL